MSKSFYKIPIMGIAACKREKQDKRIAHRIDRRNIKQHLNIDPLNFSHIDRKEFRFNNVFSFGKDGKHYFGELKYTDRDFYNKLLRK